ncbi:bifunctional 3-phenylpropionate/cinnamic acid dioxygenase ferredoxin subunit [Pseudonocardia sp. TRM90224]|uniref:bifunctional 3-phenylpropionate/cinnamic acid dioxygenase ferredoxin subunit n=1 Tax=Pseudonocardia sp. TRM90224 TaxID=2812678 RepID=UPI001E542B0B|nr:bifunctional 3-phenylpropionate/cinnamic acid dioxygenase ferredoxin subunit [Pseudonocardia sp. TRM90224]
MIHVCALADMPRGSARRLPLVPPVSVFHTSDGEFYAIDDTCTHQDASLADGWLEGCEVECPLHAAIFDLRTGEPDGLLARKPVRTHRVLVEADSVYLVLSTPDVMADIGGDELEAAS